jgi:hypothetical protein
MWLAQLPLLALFIKRLLQPTQSRRNFSPTRQLFLKTIRYGLVGLSAAAMVVILVVVLTGRSGLIPTV